MPRLVLLATGDTIAYGRHGLLKAAGLLPPGHRHVDPLDLLTEPAFDMTSSTLLAAVSDLTEWGIPVVIASRCRSGTTAFSDGSDWHRLPAGVGAIDARGLSARKARLALMVALGSGSPAGVRRWFEAIWTGTS